MLINYIPLIFGLTVFGLVVLLLPKLGVILGIISVSILIAILLVWLFEWYFNTHADRPILPLYNSDCQDRLQDPFLSKPVFQEVVVDPVETTRNQITTDVPEIHKNYSLNQHN